MLAALYPEHREFVNTLLANPALDLATLLERLNALQSIDNEEPSTVYTAQGGARPDRPRETCSTPDCPKPETHTWPYCTYAGGGMAGKTIREAQQKARADRQQPQPQTQTQTPAQPPAPPASKDSKPSGIKKRPDGRAYITIGEEDFLLSPSEPPPDLSAATAFIDAANLTTDPLPTSAEIYNYESFLADNIDFQASLNWDEWTVASADASKSDFEIFADTGANISLSPCRDDFISFREIPPR
ncbi:hypothetical protein C8F04DRAFT_1270521 [Mycena alexandri]|uniref:Uncharacterized protein n=1 Tax=Mycena alexandri TaxID=1745969 RepID=A0AAD6SAL0_9AGAR|nr:hypothetical protein C8F04DRAFT_1270521 [Mycena alexandri]